VWQPDAHSSRLLQLTNQRASLVADRTSIENRIHALLYQRVIRPRRPVGKSWSKDAIDRIEVMSIQPLDELSAPALLASVVTTDTPYCDVDLWPAMKLRAVHSAFTYSGMLLDRLPSSYGVEMLA